jgi:hypothetical protein
MDLTSPTSPAMVHKKEGTLGALLTGLHSTQMAEEDRMDVLGMHIRSI